MLVKAFFVFVLASYCFADFFRFVVDKDEEAGKVLADPRGTDTELFNVMKTVGDSFELLTKYLRLRNASMMADSRKLFERGRPDLLSRVFSSDSLRVHFGWMESDLHYFNYVYNDVENKWNTFHRVFKNASAYV